MDKFKTAYNSQPYSGRIMYGVSHTVPDRHVSLRELEARSVYNQNLPKNRFFDEDDEFVHANMLMEERFIAKQELYESADQKEATAKRIINELRKPKISQTSTQGIRKESQETSES